MRNVGGVKKIVVIARSRDKYSPKIVKTANQVRFERPHQAFFYRSINLAFRTFSNVSLLPICKAFGFSIIYVIVCGVFFSFAVRASNINYSLE